LNGTIPGCRTQHIDPLGIFQMDYLGETGQITSRQLVGGSVFTNWTYDTNTNDRRLLSINDSSQRQFIFSTSPEALIKEVKGITVTVHII
jgi:hypothetical protein